MARTLFMILAVNPLALLRARSFSALPGRQRSVWLVRWTNVSKMRYTTTLAQIAYVLSASTQVCKEVMRLYKKLVGFRRIEKRNP